MLSGKISKFLEIDFAARCDAYWFNTCFNLLMHIQSYFNKLPLSSTRDKIYYNMPFWLAAALVALISVAYNYLFNYCEELAISYSSTYWVYVFPPFAILGSFLVAHFISKEASGSGIPQVIACVELSQMSDEKKGILEKLLSVKMIFAKIIGSCMCILGGAVTGREGPTLQISAAVFYQINKYWPKKLPQPNLSSMLLAGGAAGLASAFNTPLGGVVFAIEEMSKSHISTIRTAVFQAVILAGVLAQVFLGNYLYLGTAQYLHPSWHVLYQTVFVALVTGLFGAVFAESLFKINQWRMKKSLQQKILIAFVFGVLFSALIWLCGVQVTGSGKSLMVNLLSTPESHVSLEITVGRILGSLFTYSGGVIGGIFAPALSSGAAIGQFIAQSFEFINVKIMIMVGMVGFLTGITRTPFTSFVLVLEMSDSHEIIIYLMLASMVSNVVGKMINPKSFYEQVAHGLIHADKK